jgi:hypothetical protein
VVSSNAYLKLPNLIWQSNLEVTTWRSESFWAKDNSSALLSNMATGRLRVRGDKIVDLNGTVVTLRDSAMGGWLK